MPDMLEYIRVRRLESESWIHDNIANCDVHYLNVPDNVSISQLAQCYGNEIFEKINGCKIVKYIINKVTNIIGDNILVGPHSEPHPSHDFASSIIDYLPNKCIYYNVHETFSNHIKAEPGNYIKKYKSNGHQYIEYYHIHDSLSLIKKRTEFQKYYNSQYEDFLKTGLSIKNWEKYLSEVVLKLTDEDKTFSLKEKALII